MSLRNLVLGGFAIMAAAAFTAPANAVVILDELGTIDDIATGVVTIDEWEFTLTDPLTWVDISVTSLTGDPEINLFFDDDDLTLNDFIENDDDGGALFFDAFISISLPAGDYLVRVSEWQFGVDNGTDAVIIAATNNTCLDCVGFDYNILIEGTVHGVPEPGTLALLGAALAGLGLFYRRRKVVH